MNKEESKEDTLNKEEKQKSILTIRNLISRTWKESMLQGLIQLRRKNKRHLKIDHNLKI